MSDEILRHDDAGLAILTLNRPAKLNSLTIALFEALLEEIKSIAAAPDMVGVVVLRGARALFFGRS